MVKLIAGGTHILILSIPFITTTEEYFVNMLTTYIINNIEETYLLLSKAGSTGLMPLSTIQLKLYA